MILRFNFNIIFFHLIIYAIGAHNIPCQSDFWYQCLFFLYLCKKQMVTTISQDKKVYLDIHTLHCFATPR